MKLLLASILILMLSACFSDPDCFSTGTNNLQITFKGAGKGVAPKMSFSQITVSGTETVFERKDSLSTLDIPVNPIASETTFIFTYGGVVDSVKVSGVDTLVVAYSTKTLIVSPSCGADIYISNLTVPATSFQKGVKVVNSQLSTLATTNLEIKL